MTQGIQRNARPVEFSAAYLARITPKVGRTTRARRDGWFAEAVGDLFRVLIGRREAQVPQSLVDDAGLGSHVHAMDPRDEFNRLDAQLRSRIY